jgi:hypothetical protein
MIPKQKENNEVLIYITIVLKQLKKIKYPQKKREKEAMLCLPAEFFLVVKFCHLATTEK